MTQEPLDTPAGEAEPPVPPAEEALAGRQAEIEELKKELLYQRAEFDNFRKRTEKRYRDALEYATEPLVKDLLPVLDDLERALEHAQEAGGDSLAALLEGLGHVAAKLQEALSRHGVENVAAHGERFDPNFHEALLQVPGEEDNQVAQVLQKGYLLKGRLLRPARVAVSKVATREGDG
jgi:molecular chaperone GrpE